MDSPCTSLSLTEREKEKIKIYDALSEAQIIEVLETDENQLTVRFKLKKKDQKILPRLFLFPGQLRQISKREIEIQNLSRGSFLCDCLQRECLPIIKKLARNRRQNFRELDPCCFDESDQKTRTLRRQKRISF